VSPAGRAYPVRMTGLIIAVLVLPALWMGWEILGAPVAEEGPNGFQVIEPVPDRWGFRSDVWHRFHPLRFGCWGTR